MRKADAAGGEKMWEMWERILAVLLMAALIAAAGVAKLPRFAAPAAGRPIGKNAGKCVVIDAGHGGIDPGKIGVNGALEKDINLKIARKLKFYLETEDVAVVMTRERGEGLADSASGNKKVQDMKQRIRIIEETAPALTVSIHQNSYTDGSICGAQVFYYAGSREGERLAALLQTSMVRRLEPENHRQPKANDSYYLLKKTSTPIAIAECGFLSNPGEAELLCSEEYQDKVAWALHIGIMQYLNGK